MQPILSMHIWLSMKMETRNAFRAIFDIPMSGHVEVFDGRVLCDGTMMEDLLELTTEKMKDYLQSDSNDFYDLFNKVVARLEAPIVDLSEALSNAGVNVVQETPIKTITKVTKKTNAKTKKNK